MNLLCQQFIDVAENSLNLLANHLFVICRCGQIHSFAISFSLHEEFYLLILKQIIFLFKIGVSRIQHDARGGRQRERQFRQPRQVVRRAGQETQFSGNAVGITQHRDSDTVKETCDDSSPGSRALS
jgi:hypothetical protein